MDLLRISTDSPVKLTICGFPAMLLGMNPLLIRHPQLTPDASDPEITLTADGRVPVLSGGPGPVNHVERTRDITFRRNSGAGVPKTEALDHSRESLRWRTRQAA